MIFHRFALTVLLLFSAGNAHASVSIYTNKASWQAAVNNYSSITFDEFDVPSGTWLNEQYAPLGVHFTDGSDQFYNNTNVFVDGWGLNGAFDESTMNFDVPIAALAMDFPGHVRIELFVNGEIFYTSPVFGIGGVGNFAGILSTEPFDAVLIDDPLSGLSVDNIYFGPLIPAPGALALLSLGVLIPRRRRSAA